MPRATPMSLSTGTDIGAGGHAERSDVNGLTHLAARRPSATWTTAVAVGLVTAFARGRHCLVRERTDVSARAGHHPCTGLAATTGG